MLFPYRKKDFATCVELFIAAFSAPPLNYDFLTHEKTRRYLRDITQTPGFMGFVYLWEEKTAAFCFGTVDDYFHAPQFIIKELAVSPSAHGKGIGTAFMLELETHMAKNSITAMSLQTSPIIPAYHFYKKLGYTAVDNVVNLTKPLTPRIYN